MAAEEARIGAARQAAVVSAEEAWRQMAVLAKREAFDAAGGAEARGEPARDRGRSRRPPHGGDDSNPGAQARCAGAGGGTGGSGGAGAGRGCEAGGHDRNKRGGGAAALR